jgi:F-type H+-transporting ATPase subunit b
MTTLAFRMNRLLPLAALLAAIAVWLACHHAAWAEAADAASQLPSDPVTAAVEAAHGEENIGFPQLKVETYPSQVFWLFVSFGVLYFMMSRIALPRITEVLDLRQTQKSNNLNRAQSLQEEAEKIRAEVETSTAQTHAEAQGTLAAAEDEISRKANAEMARFAEHARTRIAAAESNIARAKQEALASLADISADVAADIVQKIAAVSVPKADAKKAVNAVIEGGK